MHLISENRDLGLVVLNAQRLGQLAGVSNPVAGEHGTLHRNEAASVVDPVIRVFFEM